MTTKRLTAEDLAVIEVRANAATGGEWVAYEPTEFRGDIRIARASDEYPDGRPKNTYVGRLVESHVGHEKPRREDGAFIAAARTDVTNLIAEVRALTAERDELRAIVEGRTEPPTDEEIAAHVEANGWWRFQVEDDFGELLAEEAQTARELGDVQRWWAMDADGCPCAWPKVTK